PYTTLFRSSNPMRVTQLAAIFLSASVLFLVASDALGAWAFLTVMLAGAVAGGFVGAHLGRRLPAWLLRGTLVATAVTTTVLYFLRRGRYVQIVPYTGGRNRDGGTPLLGDFITCIALGVLKKCRNEFAAADRRSAGNVLTCQHTGIGVFGVGTTASSCLRNSAATRCSMAT